MATMRDVKVHEGLMIVKLDGFKEAEEGEEGYERGGVDLPGSANWLCDAYGMSGDDYTGPGILYSDYDSAADEPWAFSVLVTSDESEALAKFARDAGYSIESVDEVDEPTVFGDGSGTVEILKHRDGWVILEN